MSASDTPGRSSPLPSSYSGLRRFLPVGIIFVVGIALTLVASMLVKDLEQQRLRGDLEGFAFAQSRSLSDSVRNYEECLYTLRSLVSASGSVNRAEFQALSADLRTRWPGIYSLRWMPCVADEDRDQFEAAARVEVDPHWMLHDELLDQPSPKRQPASQRPRYLPILYAEPLEQNIDDLGLDRFRAHHQRALQQAIESGEICATRRIPLAASGRYGWSTLLPIYRAGPPPADARERWERLQGVVEGTFELRALAAGNVSDASEALDLVLTDETRSTTEPFLFNLTKGVATTTPPTFPGDFQNGWNVTHLIHCSGRDWRLHARANAEWLAAHRSHFPVGVLLSGVCLTALVSASIFSIQSQSAIVSHLVDMRTGQLAKMQEQLREDVHCRQQAEDRYHAFVQQSTEAIWRFELDDPMPIDWPEARQIEYLHRHSCMAECNDVCAHSYGYERSKEIIGKYLHELLPLEDPQNLEHLHQFVRGQYRIVDSETHEIDAAGNTRILLSNVNGVVEDGMLVRAWGTQRDITFQRQMEQARIADAQRLRIAMASANVGLWDWNTKTDRAEWSDELQAMFGLKPGEFDGSPSMFFRFIHPADQARVLKYTKELLEKPREFEFEYRIIRPDGAERWIFGRGDVKCDERGQAVGMVGAAIDITAHKEAESERSKIEQKLQDAQKLESLGVLAGGIAHDFNNLLTGVIGNAALARMDLPPTSPIQYNLGQIEEASLRAADLCKQMLAYAGKGRLIIQLVDLSQLVQETASLLKVSISKDAELQLKLTAKLPSVSADATQLRQIVMNLVINASEALGDRSGRIQLRTGMVHANRAYLEKTHLAPDLPEGDYVYLEVADTGSGMSRDTLKRIFDPFFTTKFTGRGLGLAAVLGIVRGHQGALKVDSAPGKGTTFRLLLPPAVGQSITVPDPVNEDPQWQGSGRILIIDDEETVRQVSARMLRGMGFDPLTAPDGQAGLMLFSLAPESFSVVLLDLNMPRMDGTQTFVALRRIRPDLKVVLISGYDERDAITRFARRGLSGFLQKPFTPRELSEVLRPIVEANGEIFATNSFAI